MQHQGTIRNAALKGNGWRNGGKFSLAAMVDHGPAAKRAARLKAAIRRIELAKDAKERAP